jgi:hypothetical protein
MQRRSVVVVAWMLAGQVVGCSAVRGSLLDVVEVARGGGSEGSSRGDRSGEGSRDGEARPPEPRSGKYEESGEPSAPPPEPASPTHSGPPPGGHPARSGHGGPGFELPPALFAQMTMFYTQFMFSMAFGSGGFAIGSSDFKPGQYVRFQVPGQGESKGSGRASGSIERAYLGDDGEGNQWWKVKFVGDDKKEAVILEALLSPKDGKMLRLRGKFPQEPEGREMAVTENSTYVPPTRLSPKSVEGATKGVESVTVPAGTFNARHVVFGDGLSTFEWWLADKVPGGTVKQLGRGGGPGQAGSGRGGEFVLELVAFGGDAQTELGTKLR